MKKGLFDDAAEEQEDAGAGDGSFASRWTDHQSQMSAAQKRREDVQAQVNDARKKGSNMRKVLIDGFKPERDIDREDRIRRTAKVQAFSNLISALGSGIVGMRTKGYVPKTGNNYPDTAIKQLDDIEKAYLEQDKDFKRMQFQNAMTEHGEEQQALANELAAIDKEIAAGNRHRERMDIEDYKANVKAGLQKEKIDWEGQKLEKTLANNIDVASIRGNTTIRAASIAAASRIEAAIIQAGAKGGTGKGGVEYTILGENGNKKVIDVVEAKEYIADAIEFGFSDSNGIPKVSTITKTKPDGKLTSTETATTESPTPWGDVKAFDMERVMQMVENERARRRRQKTGLPRINNAPPAQQWAPLSPATRNMPQPSIDSGLHMLKGYGLNDEQLSLARMALEEGHSPIEIRDAYIQSGVIR